MSAIVLGLAALAIAAIEMFVFAVAGASAGGANQGMMSGFGTMAYVAGYSAAGVILIAIGVWKIFRA